MLLPPSCTYLQIVPHVPIALTSRLYRLFVTVNGNKTFEVNRIPVTAGINGASAAQGYEGGKKKGEPVYEAKLVVGVNRVEVEIVAEKEKKAGTTKEGGAVGGKDRDTVDVEKCTLFLHLKRAS